MVARGEKLLLCGPLHKSSNIHKRYTALPGRPLFGVAHVQFPAGDAVFPWWGNQEYSFQDFSKVVSRSGPKC